MRLPLSIGFILAILCHGCISDAPRENPLDPALDINRNVAQVTGRVNRINGNGPVRGATLTSQAQNLFARSDAQGDYRIGGIPLSSDSLLLHCAAEGFQPDSASVVLAAGSISSLDFQLNALPVFDALALFSRREADFNAPEGKLFLEISLQVSDPDGANDIETVHYDIADIGVADTLRLIPAEQRYFTRVSPAEIGLTSLESMLGKTVHITARDVNGAAAVLSDGHLRRIIDIIPRTVSPSGSASIPFTFRWENADTLNSVPFEFTYRIEIYEQLPVQLPPVDVLPAIPSTETRWQYVNSALSAGVYYWVLYMVDEFGNRSRSFQAPLTIQ